MKELKKNGSEGTPKNSQKNGSGSTNENNTQKGVSEVNFKGEIMNTKKQNGSNNKPKATKLKCKYLMANTRGWNKKLIEACCNLETFIESFKDFIPEDSFTANSEGIRIYDSWSDHQPSYLVVRRQDNKRFCYEVRPRIINGKQIYLVIDEINKTNRAWEMASIGTTSITRTDHPIGSLFKPYRWGINTLKRKIINIDMDEGYTK